MSLHFVSVLTISFLYFCIFSTMNSRQIHKKKMEKKEVDWVVSIENKKGNSRLSCTWFDVLCSFKAKWISKNRFAQASHWTWLKRKEGNRRYCFQFINLHARMRGRFNRAEEKPVNGKQNFLTFVHCYVRITFPSSKEKMSVVKERK